MRNEERRVCGGKQDLAVNGNKLDKTFLFWYFSAADVFRRHFVEVFRVNTVLSSLIAASLFGLFIIIGLIIQPVAGRSAP